MRSCDVRRAPEPYNGLAIHAFACGLCGFDSDMGGIGEMVHQMRGGTYLGRRSGLRRKPRQTPTGQGILV